MADSTHTPEAFAANITLDGKVEYCIIPDEPDAVSGPLALQYGDETPHWGFTVRWIVVEHVDIIVS